MAQFDVHRLRTGELVLDCQADMVSKIIKSRFVIPLCDPETVPNAIKSLHPAFRVEGKELLLLTQLASAIPGKDLSKAVQSLESERYTIIKALDFLLTVV
jgi:toxin CcdB